MKIDDIKTIEHEIDVAIQNCIKLEKRFPKAPKQRKLVFDLREMLKRKRIKQPIIDIASEMFNNRNIQINDSSVHGSIVCTIDLNTVALTTEQAKELTK